MLVRSDEDGGRLSRRLVTHAAHDCKKDNLAPAVAKVNAAKPGSKERAAAKKELADRIARIRLSLERGHANSAGRATASSSDGR